MLIASTANAKAAVVNGERIEEKSDFDITVEFNDILTAIQQHNSFRRGYFASFAKIGRRAKPDGIRA